MNKFKVGDKVRALDNATKGQFIKGKIYEVSLVREDSISVVSDSNGDPNGWGIDHFELAVHDFNDLIDVAVQAHKDGFISSQLMIMSDRIHFFGSDRETITFTNKSVVEGIDFIKSLYTETFVIEYGNDIERVKVGASIELANGCEIDAEMVTRIDDLWIVDTTYAGRNFAANYLVLKGATVTQTMRGK